MKKKQKQKRKGIFANGIRAKEWNVSNKSCCQGENRPLTTTFKTDVFMVDFG